jgi:recombination protein RecT
MADIQKAAAPTGLMTMKALIQKYSPDIQRLIPTHVDAEKIVMIAQAALSRNPKLLECDPRTVLAGIIQCSILGLELHTALHHAVLLPFWNDKMKCNEALLMIEYPGLIELVMRGGHTNYVEAQPVYENDFLEIEFGTNARLVHKPEVKTTRGKLIGSYAYAKLKTGDTKFHYMTVADIEERRAVSKAKDSGPWKSWEAEMYAKTPLRHLCKQLRKTTELAIALEHESRFEQGVNSVVEGGEGLSLDFLAMNIEAKSLEAKEDLKKKIADKIESTKKALTKPPETQAPPPAAAAAPASEPDMENLSATPPAMTPEHEALAKEFTQGMELGLKEGVAPSAPATPIVVATSAAKSKDPLDAFIGAEEVRRVLTAIKDRQIQDTKVRAKLDELNVKLIRNLTKRQWRTMMEWIERVQ